MNTKGTFRMLAGLILCAVVILWSITIVALSIWEPVTP